MDEFTQINILLNKMWSSCITQNEYQYLQFLLLKYERYFRNSFPVGETTMTDLKITFISDTHKGGKDENINLITKAYNKSLQENVKTVIHCGDLTEACANNLYNKPFEVVQEELEQALFDMPKEITTKLLIGNHDYSAIRTYPILLTKYFENQKLQIIGIKKALLNWYSCILSINHPIKQNTNANNKKETNIDLYGHYHKFLFEPEKTFKLPPLCKDTNEQITKALSQYGLNFIPFMTPSFLIASIQDENTYLFEFYCINKSSFNIEEKVFRYVLNSKTNKITEYN